MLSKFQLLRCFTQLGPRSPIGMCMNNHVTHLNLFCNYLCSVSGSTNKINESPEIPSWVKFSDKEISDDSKDDDFVIPEIAYWIENHSISFQTRDVTKNILAETMMDSDADKISKILKYKFTSIDSVVEGLKRCVVDLSESLVEQILKRFSNDWISAFGFFKWGQKQMGSSKYSATLYNMMIDILGKSRKFDLMWELFEEMHLIGGYVTEDTMSIMVRRFAKAHKWEDAIKIFRKFEQYGFGKNISMMNMVMDALVKGESVELAESVYNEFKNQISPNSSTFNVLVNGWCNARKLDKARSTMEEMKKHGFSPDVFTYTSLVKAYSREKDFRKVDALLNEMHENNCSPNVVTYTVVILALGKAKELGKAMEFYEKMKKSGCVPDASFYSTWIYILNKAGRLQDAREIFDDMPKRGVTPEVMAYSSMIAAYCDHSHEETALKLLIKMEEDHCKPDVQTYAPLLKMCCKKKRMKVLAFLLDHMLKNDVSLDLGTYALLVRGLCKSGKLEQACSFFEDLVSKGLVPMDCTYKLLIKELERKSMAKEKERITKLMSLVKEGQMPKVV
ncbi:Pentatricopeptide repeat [Dillenia turbinata]|uniref:Pentatricopeptide repeat n=1 Tax=Dillenia turbinata TaxID=194707 RepID=A0AAN8UH80_9MAGN